MMVPTLYTQNTIHKLKVPDSELGHLLKRYWLPLMKQGAQHFINNVQTELQVITVDDLALPVTVTQWQSHNSYVCSTYAHYITYAKEELYTLQNPYLEKFLKEVLTCSGALLRTSKIDQSVMVNNWLLSTNLYPSISKRQIALITTQLVQNFPKAAILFRSLNTCQNGELISNFQQAHYQMIASRQVYLLDPKNLTSLKSKTRWRLKQDQNLFQQTGYEVISMDEIAQDDIPRLTLLYKRLYLDKYCDNNPQFNQNFLKLVIQNKALTLKALRKNGHIDGVIGFYQLNQTMTTPILGYDTGQPQSLGLYRMLSLLLIKEATQRQLVLHQSSGASSFKRFRGFTGYLEYSAVYTCHLSDYQKYVWSLLQYLANSIGVPLMQKFQL